MRRPRPWLALWSVIAAATLLGLGAPVGEAQQTKAKAGEAVAKVDLNTATQAELEKLPGVGEATAKKIIAGRPYASLADLSKAGVSKSAIKKITPLVMVGGAAAAATGTAAPEAKKAATSAAAGAKLDLNGATQAELEKLPGVGEATAKKIIAGRPYASLADLSKAGVSKSAIKKITPLVMVGGAAAAAGGAAVPAATAPAQASTPVTKTTAKTASETTAPAPPAKGMVWVNIESKVYHKEGDRWYGKTKHGKYMTEADAVKDGYRASKEP